VAVGHTLAPGAFWICVILAGAALAGSWWRRTARRREVLVYVGMALVGAAWALHRTHAVDELDLAAWVTEQPCIVHVEGVALREPKLRMRAAGSMARFDYRPPATYFPLRVQTIFDQHGTAHPARGELYVRVDEVMMPFHAGDTVQATGFLRRPGEPSNPGEFDYRAYAAARGQAGVLTVKSRALVDVTQASGWNALSRVLAWRDALRRRAGGWLLADLVPTGSTTTDTARGERNALLAAILLGQREPDLDGIDRTFRRVGLAHLLAISGLHLGILVGLVLLIAHQFTDRRRVLGLCIILAVLAYLFLIEVRMPVLRAGVMALVVAGGMLINRRWRVQSLIALAGVGLLIWRPDQIFNAGFQLSFGVVLGLTHFATRVRTRWFGPVDDHAASSAQMIGQWLKTALAVAFVAWAIATPIALHHFGFFSPLAVPLSVMALPIVALLLAVGYSKMVLTLTLPSGALILGTVLALTADFLLSLVSAIDALPGATINVPQPGPGWAVAALAWVCVWGAGRFPQQPRRMLAAAGIIVIWLYWPVLPVHARPALRIDTLAVGDGSCHILRSGGATYLVDAGSNSGSDVGSRIIVPALRALHIQRVDGLFISHPNLDHYNAVLEIAHALPVGKVIVTPQLLAYAESNPYGPVATLVDHLTALGVSIVPHAAGDTITLGNAMVTWLHPPPGQLFERRNNGSAVLRLDVAGRTVLFTGDVQRDAIRMLQAAHPNLRADILELPHHGSYNAAVEALVRNVQPSMVLQSTGPMRLDDARWREALAETEHLVTARDGACTILIDHDGTITTQRFLHGP